MKKEIIAYAITHAPRGVKGGPYESWRWWYGSACSDLREALRWCSDSPLTNAEWVTQVLKDVRDVVPTARVIRIVRKARPPETSAVEVLRDMLATWDDRGFVRTEAFARARAVLAASGPDPMPVVLREARSVLALCTTSRGARHASEYEAVKRFGGVLGYGATMQAASAAWAEMFDGTPQAGAQHTCGPAECTVQRALAAIDRVLAGGK